MSRGHHLHFLLCLITASLLLTAQAVGGNNKAAPCHIVRIVPERLPDLNVARSGHNIFYANGELTVTGGHTTNFVPMQTAEYFLDGKWHSMTMAYTHDNGFAVVLRSGEVIIGGGHDEPLGIGQTFMLERYHPQTHSFDGFGCLDRRRVLANAAQLADGRVIISGNHYAPDDVACYDGCPQVEQLMNPRQERSNPYILPIAADDALILSGSDLHMNHPDTVWVDRLKGEPFHVPLLDEWKPVYTDQPFSSEASRMDDHAYLLTAVDSTGQLAIIRITPNDQTNNQPDDWFSLLSTVSPIPMAGPHGRIAYKGPMVVDRQRRRGYVIGIDSTQHHQYVLAVDYGVQPAGLTLYYTDSLEHATVAIPIVTPEGDLILAGGNPEDNYKPLATVWCYHFVTAAPTAAGTPLCLWLLLAAVLLLAIAYLVMRYITKRTNRRSPKQLNDPSSKQPDNQLMASVCQSLEANQRYLTSPLRVSDVAFELGVTVSDVTNCISRERGLTFVQLIAEYRVRHAQRLLCEQPDIKLVTLIADSGFTSESTFFRTFKAVTGLSPKEWLTQQKQTIKT